MINVSCINGLYICFNLSLGSNEGCTIATEIKSLLSVIFFSLNGIRNRAVNTRIEIAVFFELFQKLATEAAPKYIRSDAPAIPNIGSKLDSSVSTETVPGISHGNPPKKKSLVSSISNKAADI